MTILSIDFETRSAVDLRKTGSRRYAADPSTSVICMAWAFDNDPVQIWHRGQRFPRAVLDHVLTFGTVRAWNAGFELDIWRETLCHQEQLAVPLWPDQLEDTMARAAYWGLPLSLEKAADALGVQPKDKAGHKLMLQMCRPRTTQPLTWWDETDPAKLQSLLDYCKTDVEVERAIANKLPLLPSREREIWIMDRVMNRRGIAVDQDLVEKLMVLTADAKAVLNRRLSRLTSGAVSTAAQTGALLTWLKANGYPHDDLKRNTIKDRIPVATGMERAALEIRRDAARASTAKLAALTHAAHGGRIHNTVQYYGASRTGRFAGRIFQPQNIPRPVIKNPEAMIEAVLAGAGHDDVQFLSTDSVMGAVASMLRGCLVARPGHLLVSADLSQIEARVVAWLSGQQDVLDVFAAGVDIYTYDAQQIGSQDRQLGKVCRLALGFGMGPPKFVLTAWGYGIRLKLETAETIVRAWRTANDRTVRFWWDCDDAARRIAAGERSVRVGMVRFIRHGNSMLIELPSGRHLVYRRIRLEYDPVTDRDAVVYDGMNQYTKQWGPCRTYGGKLVENITQAVARDVMVDAMLDMDAAKIPLVLSVHDEAVAEAHAHDGARTLLTMLTLMKKPRPWTAGLPVDAAGWIGPRYRKG